MTATLPAFDEPDLARTVERISAEDLDALPFGAVLLDGEGRVLRFSDAERRLSGFGDRDALGKAFFSEIAPCMGNPFFQARIARAAEAGTVDIEMSHIGDFDDRDREIHVRILSATGGGLWLFLRRIE